MKAARQKQITVQISCGKCFEILAMSNVVRVAQWFRRQRVRRCWVCGSRKLERTFQLDCPWDQNGNSDDVPF